MPHGRHFFAKAYDMAEATMFAYPQSNHAFPHWKLVFRCCAKCSCINLPDQETDTHYSDTTPSMRFHISHIIARCTDHGRSSNLLSGAKLPASRLANPNVHRLLIPQHLPNPALPNSIYLSSNGRNLPEGILSQWLQIIDIQLFLLCSNDFLRMERQINWYIQLYNVLVRFGHDFF